MSEDRTRVLIVGAGPAGAALAQLLASRGIEVRLLERQLDFAREFRGELLMPSGIEALEQMALEGLKDVPQRRPTSIEAFARGQPFFRQEITPHLFPGPMPTAMSQPALLELLVEQAGRSPGFRLERGATVRELIHDGGRCVGVRARTPEGEREFRADLVVGADGRSSVVRARAGLAPEREPQVMDVVWCKFPMPGAAGREAPGRAYLGRGHLLFAYRAPDERLQVAWIIQKGTFRELREGGTEAWIEAMAAHVSADYAHHFRARAGEVSRPFLLDAALDRVASWTRPGLLLLGDAAHTMSPVGGQGVNIALRDAIVAANHLVPACTGGASPAELDAAARRIEAERVPEIVHVQRLQAMPPRVLVNRAAWAEPARRLVPLLMQSRFVQGLAARALAVFAFGATAVRLRV
ncbi:MAG: FAD-dependent monooxygenase [Myxococcota bacterium]|nr:FAD-dependent monooxygenase [Myxococcota bacterium]